MTHSHSLVLRSLRLLTLSASLLISVAHADEYADVSQLLQAGKLTEAMTKADQYLAGKPRDPQMRFLKGVIQRDTGKTADAISTFSRLAEDYPELPEPYNNLAVLYAGQSQFDKARTALEMAIRTNPSYATAHENLGDVYAKLASQAYSKALQLDATNPAVPPKLALIRELFSAPGTKTQRAVPAANGTPAPATPTPAAVKPATLPAAVAPAPGATPATETLVNSGEREAEFAVYAWAKAWAARDIKGYLAAYGKEFDPSGSQSRSAWEEERRRRISSKSSISVKVENLTVTVNGHKAIAKFRQDYKAGGLAVSSRKTLDLVKTGDRWQIIKEYSGS